MLEKSTFICEISVCSVNMFKYEAASILVA